MGSGRCCCGLAVQGSLGFSGLILPGFLTGLGMVNPLFAAEAVSDDSEAENSKRSEDSIR